MQNFDLKEEVRAYWSARAETFDDQPAHRIEDRFGIPAWMALLADATGRRLGALPDDWRALDLACGTGEVSRALCAFGGEVTGVDFAGPMLSRATAKLAGQRWEGLASDAETLAGVPAESFDLAVARHLVWTLTDPPAAYAAWHRVLKPGGVLLIVDGDWRRKPSLLFRARQWLADRLDPRSDPDLAGYAEIIDRLPHAAGLRSKALADGLTAAGFVDLRWLDLSLVYGRGMRGWPLADRLRLSTESRMACSAKKPDLHP